MMAKREELIKVVQAHFIGCLDRWAEPVVDDILDALMEPGEGAIRKGQEEMPVEIDYWQEQNRLHCKMRSPHECVPPGNVLRAILTHIKEEKA